MVSSYSFPMIAKLISQFTCLIGFDQIHATLIFTIYFWSIFSLKLFLHIQGISYPSVTLWYHINTFLVIDTNIFCSLYIFFLCLSKLSSLIWTLHSRYCTVKAALEISPFWDELLFLTIFFFSDVLVERETNYFSFDSSELVLCVWKQYEHWQLTLPLYSLQWKWFIKVLHDFVPQISAYNKGSASQSWLKWMKCRLLNCSWLFSAGSLSRSVEQSLSSNKDRSDLVCAF